MSQIKLIKKYPNVSPAILRQYKPHAKEIIYHEDDKDLTEIKIKLPSPPELHKIAGFGLPAKKQKFTPPVMPEKLRKLVEKTDLIDDIWNELERNQLYYKEEIKFIKRQWYYLLNGYWCFINGTPTYIDGWHWFYCSWWNIDIGIPDYRSRDWKFFHFARHCATTTIAVFNYKVFYDGSDYFFSKKDTALAYCKELGIEYSSIEAGRFEIDMKKRTIIGFNYAKFRREGATYKAECIGYCIAIVTKNGRLGIQSMTDDHAEGVFSIHLISPWKGLPFFFKPNYEGSTDPKSWLSFNPPPQRLSSKGSKALSPVGLNTLYDFQKANGDGYDGKKLVFHHHDEVGKFAAPLDINVISQRIKPCLTLDKGQTIIGLGIKTSTVGDTNPGGGGQLFKNYCEGSMYDDRNANGQTLTGYVNLFIPTRDGIVVDEFGNSVIDDPKEKILDKHGNIIKKGGRRVIQDDRKKYLEEGKFDELALEKRENPESFAECFSVTSSGSSLPKGIVELRLEQLAFHNPKKRRGNLYWVKGFGSDVEWMDDPLGKWYMSLLPPKYIKNQRRYDRVLSSWVPLQKFRTCLGVDPFKSNQPKGSKRSEGGGVVFFKHDIKLDPYEDSNKWVNSNRFTMTYSYRTYNKEEFFEDMLMTAIFWSCGVFPELNLPEVWEWFDKNGYNEYMIFPVDYATGKESITPGATFANNTYKEQMFAEYRQHLSQHGLKEVHDELLIQIRDIQNPSEITKYDLFAAGGWSLIGAKSMYFDERSESEDKKDIRTYFKQYRV